jgi:hypothetical protein
MKTMNKPTLFFLIYGIMNLFLGCSKDSETNTPPVVYPKTEAKINSFSKNYGYTGETIIINGENFTDKVGDVSLKFDEIPATIVSATNTEIKCILPAFTKVIPKLNLNITNRNITNLVVNDYDSNIGILPSIRLNSWIAVENSLKSSNVINRVQMTSNKSVYYTMSDNATGNVIFRSLDDGISWKYWSFCGFDKSPFLATINDEGWAYTGFGLRKVPVGGSQYISHIWNETIISGLSVNPDLTRGTIVTQAGLVYDTIDGVNFNIAYRSTLLDGTNLYGVLYEFSQIDVDHLWVGGYKETTTLVDNNPIKTKKPFLLFKNDNTGWKEFVFSTELHSGIDKIYFLNSNIGFLSTNAYTPVPEYQNKKIFKTTNGGDTWTEVYNKEKFTNFTFKDENTGWAILENKIYKTTNGGTSWQLDYTHNENLRNISYKDNVVWAFSNDKILKYFM